MPRRQSGWGLGAPAYSGIQGHCPDWGPKDKAPGKILHFLALLDHREHYRNQIFLAFFFGWTYNIKIGRLQSKQPKQSKQSFDLLPMAGIPNRCVKLLPLEVLFCLTERWSMTVLGLEPAKPVWIIQRGSVWMVTPTRSSCTSKPSLWYWAKTYCPVLPWCMSKLHYFFITLSRKLRRVVKRNLNEFRPSPAVGLKLTVSWYSNTYLPCP